MAGQMNTEESAAASSFFELAKKKLTGWLSLVLATAFSWLRSPTDDEDSNHPEKEEEEFRDTDEPEGGEEKELWWDEIPSRSSLASAAEGQQKNFGEAVPWGFEPPFVSKFQLDDNFAFLNVAVYEVDLEDCLYTVPRVPLISYNQAPKNKSGVHWGYQPALNPNRSLFVVDLCLIKGRNFVQHLLPGAYVKFFLDSDGNKTDAERRFEFVENRFAGGYKFDFSEITLQTDVKLFLQNHLTSEVILFHKGGFHAKLIGQLCGVKSVVDIERYGCKPRLEISDKISSQNCRLHKFSYFRCPCEMAAGYLRLIDTWLPSYLAEASEANDE